LTSLIAHIVYDSIGCLPVSIEWVMYSLLYMYDR